MPTTLRKSKTHNHEKEQDVVAVIVARKGSVRIKNKSMLLLGSETLIARKIRQLRECKEVSRVVFGSNCDDMLAHAQACGAEVVRRDEYFCDETKATANEVIRDMCSRITADVIVWAHCTNPFISPATYDAVVCSFFDHLDKYDSLLSVVALREHLWNGDKIPLNYNPYTESHVPARELSPLYMQDGGIFIQPHEQMKANAYFFGKRPQLFEIPDEEFLDINVERDYWFAQAIHGHRCAEEIGDLHNLYFNDFSKYLSQLRKYIRKGQ